jgi:hypothetical protein
VLAKRLRLAPHERQELKNGGFANDEGSEVPSLLQQPEVRCFRTYEMPELTIAVKGSRVRGSGKTASPKFS